MKRSTHPLAQKSQRWISEALFRLMEQKPFKEITITEIAAEAGVDRRTFYRNFQTKDDILKLTAETLLAEYRERLSALPEKTIYGMLEAYFAFWADHKQLLFAFQRNGLLGLLLAKYGAYLPSLYEELHGKLDERTIYGMAYQNGGFWNILHQWLIDGAVKTPKEMAELMTPVINDMKAYWHPFT